MVCWSPGTHLFLGARVGKGCKEVLTLFLRLDTHEKSWQDPISATERRQSRFLLNCTCEIVARGPEGKGQARWKPGSPLWGSWGRWRQCARERIALPVTSRWAGMQLVPTSCVSGMGK